MNEEKSGSTTMNVYAETFKERLAKKKLEQFKPT